MNRPMLHCVCPTVVRVLIAAAACTPAIALGQVRTRPTRNAVVTLHRVSDRAPAEGWPGLTNIFFAPVPSSMRTEARFGEQWSAIEVADVVMGDGLRTIYAARYKMPGSDELHYVVDTAGRLDFVHARPLDFEQQGAARVANLDIEVRSSTGAHRRIPYQVLLADGYTYARIAEYLTGQLRVNGHTYAIKVRSSSRDDPFYGPTPNTSFVIDLNGDGTLAEQPTVTAEAGPVGAEQVLPRTPFLLRGRAFEVVDLDSTGSTLLIRSSTVTVAAVENFKGPELSAKTLAGSDFLLSKQLGRVVLIEFWSVNCGFSEKVRPDLNDLSSALQGMPFAWVAAARERDTTEIQHHLAEHPIAGTIALFDSTAWATYNPMGVTPLFVVIDQKGIVRLRAMGASAITAVAPKVKALVARSGPRSGGRQ